MRVNIKKINKNLDNDFTNKILYKLNRFFFIFFPFNLLLVKIFNNPQITIWKEIIIILNLLMLIFYLKDLFLKRYILVIFTTLLIDVFLGRLNAEYILWLSSGLPIYNYFKHVSFRNWINDLRIVIVLVCFGAIWIYFFESTGNYGYFFVPEKEDFTLLRGDSFRMRYCFVSPMALSQFCWFCMICIYITPQFSKIFKIIALSLLSYILIIANTRAGYLLLGVSFVMLIYSNFYKVKKWVVFSIMLVGAAFIINQMLVNSVAQSDTSISDAARFIRIQNGVSSLESNWLFGMGGEYFSPRSDYFSKVSNFENSWLSLIYSFGTLGIVLLVMVFGKLGANISSGNYKFLCFSIGWLLYSILFPILQEAVSIYITWCILAFSCHYEKFEYFVKQRKKRNPDLFNSYGYKNVF